MKLFSQDFYDSKVMLWLFVVIFLFASVRTIHAQDVKGALPGDDLRSVQMPVEVLSSLPGMAKRSDPVSEPRNNLPAGTGKIGNTYHWSALKSGVERRIAYPEQTTSTQATTNSGYVFPTKDERLKRYAWNTFGPLSLIGIGVAAGFDHHRKDPVEWGQGGSGYAKRYASRFGQYAIEGTVTYGLSEAFRLDTGFQKSNRSGFGPRLQDALLQSVTSRTRSGKRILSAPRLAGAYVGGIIPAVTWYPSRFGYKDGLRQGTTSLAVGFGVNVLREFIFHR